MIRRLGGIAFTGGFIAFCLWLVLAGLTSAVKRTMGGEGIEASAAAGTRTESVSDVSRTAVSVVPPRQTTHVAEWKIAQGRQPVTLPSPGASADRPAVANLREAFQQAGAEFLRSGRTIDDLPPIEGTSDGIQDYLAFADRSGFRFLMLSPANEVLGEMSFRTNGAHLRKATIAFKQYSRTIREIEHPWFSQKTQEVARQHGLQYGKLIALVPHKIDAYMVGKVQHVLNQEGLAPQAVRSIVAQFGVKQSLPTMMVGKIRLANGEEIAIFDPEG